MIHERSLGYAKSVSLLFGLCIGPGLVVIPSMFRELGSICTILGLSFTGILAFSSCWMLLYSQARLSISRGSRIAFLLLCNQLCMRPVYLAITVVFTLSLTMMSFGGMLQVTLAMDHFIAHSFGYVCGIQLNDFAWVCSEPDFPLFPQGSIVITEGYLTSLLLIAPMSFFKPQAITNMHILLHVVLIHTLLWLCLSLSPNFDSTRVPSIGRGLSLGKFIGACFFSFTVAISVPGWNTERLLSAGAKRTIAFAITSATAVMLIVGYVVACSVSGFDGEMIKDVGRTSNWGAIACVTLLSMIEHLCSLPVISLMLYATVTICYDKDDTKAFLAQMAGTLVPWVAVVPLYQGQALTNIIEYGGLLFTGITCFIVPPLLFIIALHQSASIREVDISNVESVSEAVYLLEDSNMHVDDDERETLNEQFPEISSSTGLRVAYLVALSQLGIVSCALLITLGSTLKATFLGKHESHWKFFSSNSNFCHTNFIRNVRVSDLAPLDVGVVEILLVVASEGCSRCE